MRGRNIKRYNRCFFGALRLKVLISNICGSNYFLSIFSFSYIGQRLETQVDRSCEVWAAEATCAKSARAHLCPHTRFNINDDHINTQRDTFVHSRRTYVNS